MARNLAVTDSQRVVAGLRSQLVALNCDLLHFTKAHSSAVLIASIRDRIRHAEGELARAEDSAYRARAGIDSR